MRLPLAATSKTAPPDSSDLHLRVVVQDQSAKVYLEQSGNWIEAMPGKFALAQVLTNAAIVGVNAEGPGPGSWIENWAVLVTAIDDNSLQTEWTRVVNNIEPSSKALPTFSMAATGVLRRTSP